jgi:preprotein translocase subunit SecA
VIQRQPRAPRQMVAQHAEAQGLAASQAQQETPERPQPAAVAAPVQSGPRVGRNDPCPCGSGKKYKKCHMLIDQGVESGR